MPRIHAAWLVVLVALTTNTICGDNTPWKKQSGSTGYDMALAVAEGARRTTVAVGRSSAREDFLRHYTQAPVAPVSYSPVDNSQLVDKVKTSDLTGTQDVYADYIELSSPYTGSFVFVAPRDSINHTTVTEIGVHARTRGDDIFAQSYGLDVYNHSAGVFHALGDLSGYTTAWEWHDWDVKMEREAGLEGIIEPSSGEIIIRYRTTLSAFNPVTQIDSLLVSMAWRARCPVEFECGLHGNFSFLSCGCECMPGWIGDICDECVISCVHDGVADPGLCSCACSGNWGGPRCEMCSLTTCPGNREIVDPVTCSCQCEAPWQGTGCATCSLASCPNGGVLDSVRCNCTTPAEQTPVIYGPIDGFQAVDKVQTSDLTGTQDVYASYLELGSPYTGTFVFNVTSEVLLSRQSSLVFHAKVRGDDIFAQSYGFDIYNHASTQWESLGFVDDYVTALAWTWHDWLVNYPVSSILEYTDEHNSIHIRYVSTLSPFNAVTQLDYLGMNYIYVPQCDPLPSCGAHGTPNNRCSCDCDLGWKGALCDTCNRVCDKGGVFDLASCSCSCEHPWGGLDCKTCIRVASECEPHGHLDPVGCNCVCKGMWAGYSCDVCSIPSCQNGGILDADECMCMCPPAFAGPECGLNSTMGLGMSLMGNQFMIAVMNDDGSNVWHAEFGSMWSDELRDVSTDSGDPSSDMICVAGRSLGALGGTSAGMWDGVAYGINGTTGVRMWMVQEGTAADDGYFGVAYHRLSSAAFVVGATGGIMAGAVPGGMVTQRIHAGTGAVTWTMQEAAASGTTVAVPTGGGEVYASGYSTGAEQDWVLVKYDAATGARLWGITDGYASRVDAPCASGVSSGGIVVIGYTEGAMAGSWNGGKDVVVLEFDPATGARLNGLQFGTSAHDEPMGGYVTSAGVVYVSGKTKGALGGAGMGLDDLFLAKVYVGETTPEYIVQDGTVMDDVAEGVILLSNSTAVRSVGHTAGDLAGPSYGMTDMFTMNRIEPVVQHATVPNLMVSSTITISGQYFGATPPAAVSASIAGNPCDTAAWVDDSRVDCTITLMSVAVGLPSSVKVTVDGMVGRTAVIFSYTKPTITAVVPDPSQHRPSVITLMGFHFGPSAGLLSSEACSEVGWVSPTLVECSSPPSTGTGLGIRVTVNGAIGDTVNLLNYRDYGNWQAKYYRSFRSDGRAEATRFAEEVHETSEIIIDVSNWNSDDTTFYSTFVMDASVPSTYFGARWNSILEVPVPKTFRFRVENSLSAAALFINGAQVAPSTSSDGSPYTYAAAMSTTSDWHTFQPGQEYRVELRFFTWSERGTGVSLYWEDQAGGGFTPMTGSYVTAIGVGAPVNLVGFGEYVYATLDDHLVDAHSNWKDDCTHHEVGVGVVPPGFEIASDSADVRALVSGYRFGADCLVLADGSAVATDRSGGGGGTGGGATVTPSGFTEHPLDDVEWRLVYTGKSYDGAGTTFNYVLNCTGMNPASRPAGPEALHAVAIGGEASLWSLLWFPIGIGTGRALAEDDVDTTTHMQGGYLWEGVSCSPGTSLSFGVKLGGQVTEGEVDYTVKGGSRWAAGRVIGPSKFTHRPHGPPRHAYASTSFACPHTAASHLLNNPFRPAHCSSRILIRKRESGWQPADRSAEVTNTYVFGGREYATMDNTPPMAASMGCQHGYLRLPAGWQFAPRDNVTIAMVAGTTPLFGTRCLVLHDGSGIDYMGAPCGTTMRTVLNNDTLGMGGGMYPQENYYGVSSCPARILLARTAAPDTAPSRPLELTPNNLVVVGDYEYGLISDVRAGALPYGWSVAPAEARTEAVRALPSMRAAGCVVHHGGSQPREGGTCGPSPGYMEVLLGRSNYTTDFCPNGRFVQDPSASNRAAHWDAEGEDGYTLEVDGGPLGAGVGLNAIKVISSNDPSRWGGAKLDLKFTTPLQALEWGGFNDICVNMYSRSDSVAAIPGYTDPPAYSLSVDVHYKHVAQGLMFTAWGLDHSYSLGTHGWELGRVCVTAAEVNSHAEGSTDWQAFNFVKYYQVVGMTIRLRMEGYSGTVWFASGEVAPDVLSGASHSIYNDNLLMTPCTGFDSPRMYGGNGMAHNRTVVAPHHVSAPILVRRRAEGARPTVETQKIDMTVLVLVAGDMKMNTNEPALFYFATHLNRMGFHSVHLVNLKALTAKGLVLHFVNSDGSGRYLFAVLSNMSVAYYDAGCTCFPSGLSPGGRIELAMIDYEMKFKTRRIVVSAYPLADSGTTVNAAGTGDARTFSLTPLGQSLFPHILPGGTLAQTNSWYTSAAVVAPATTQALGTDELGGVYGVLYTPSDRGEMMVFFFDFASVNEAANVLFSGAVHWASKGIWTGIRRYRLNMQIDDLMMSTWTWDPAFMSNVQQSTQYRAIPEDLFELVQWQNFFNTVRLQPGSNVVLEHALNGDGKGWDYDVTPLPADADNLFLQSKTVLHEYWWESHTFTHFSLDGPRTYESCFIDLNDNKNFLMDLCEGHQNCAFGAMVTPMITGLFNKGALDAMQTVGITVAVGDNTRYYELINNVNIAHGLWSNVPTNGAEGVLYLPRFATLVFYDNSEIFEMVSEASVRAPYAGGNIESIMDYDCTAASLYLSQLRHDPYMFHQANLKMFDYPDPMEGGAIVRFSLVSMWADRLARKIQKYNAFPVEFLHHDELRHAFLDRADRDFSQVTAQVEIDPSSGNVAGLTVRAQKHTKVPFTGFIYDDAVDCQVRNETYGPDTTAWVHVHDDVGEVFVKARPGAMHWGVLESTVAKPGPSPSVASRPGRGAAHCSITGTASVATFEGEAFDAVLEGEVTLAGPFIPPNWRRFNATLNATVVDYEAAHPDWIVTARMERMPLHNAVRVVAIAAKYHGDTVVCSVDSAGDGVSTGNVPVYNITVEVGGSQVFVGHGGMHTTATGITIQRVTASHALAGSQVYRLKLPNGLVVRAQSYAGTLAVDVVSPPTLPSRELGGICSPATPAPLPAGEPYPNSIQGMRIWSAGPPGGMRQQDGTYTFDASLFTASWMVTNWTRLVSESVHGFNTTAVWEQSGEACSDLRVESGELSCKGLPELFRQPCEREVCLSKDTMAPPRQAWSRFGRMSHAATPSVTQCAATVGSVVSVTASARLASLEYAALHNFDPKASSGLPGDVCTRDPIPLPDGWQIADNNAVNKAAAGGLPWGGAECLILADGSGFNPATLAPCAKGGLMSRFDVFSDGSGVEEACFRPVHCSSTILLVKTTAAVPTYSLSNAEMSQKYTSGDSILATDWQPVGAHGYDILTDSTFPDAGPSGASVAYINVPYLQAGDPASVANTGGLANVLRLTPPLPFGFVPFSIGAQVRTCGVRPSTGMAAAGGTMFFGMNIYSTWGRFGVPDVVFSDPLAVPFALGTSDGWSRVDAMVTTQLAILHGLDQFWSLKELRLEVTMVGHTGAAWVGGIKLYEGNRLTPAINIVNDGEFSVVSGNKWNRLQSIPEGFMIDSRSSAAPQLFKGTTGPVFSGSLFMEQDIFLFTGEQGGAGQRISYDKASGGHSGTDYFGTDVTGLLVSIYQRSDMVVGAMTGNHSAVVRATMADGSKIDHVIPFTGGSHAWSLVDEVVHVPNAAQIHALDLQFRFAGPINGSTWIDGATILPVTLPTMTTTPADPTSAILHGVTPRVYTYDGATLQSLSPGHFILHQDDDLKVHIQQERYGVNGVRVTGMALRHHDGVIVQITAPQRAPTSGIDPSDEVVLLVDGERVHLADREGSMIDSMSTLVRKGSLLAPAESVAYHIDLVTSGATDYVHRVVVSVSRLDNGVYFMGLSITLPNEVVASPKCCRGLVGDPDGSAANDRMGGDPDNTDFSMELGKNLTDSWRIVGYEDSLLSHDMGKGPMNLYEPAFWNSRPTSFLPAQIQVAGLACEDAGVPVGMTPMCMDDVLTSDHEISVAETAYRAMSTIWGGSLLASFTGADSLVDSALGDAGSSRLVSSAPIAAAPVSVTGFGPDPTNNGTLITGGVFSCESYALLNQSVCAGSKFVSESSMSCSDPLGPWTHNVDVRTCVAGAPCILGVTDPPRAYMNSTITISGRYFGDTAASESNIGVTVAGAVCTHVQWVDQGHVSCRAPMMDGFDLDVRVTTADGVAEVQGLFSYASPTISSIWPNPGSGVVTIDGDYFGFDEHHNPVATISNVPCKRTFYVDNHRVVCNLEVGGHGANLTTGLGVRMKVGAGPLFTYSQALDHITPGDFLFPTIGGTPTNGTSDTPLLTIKGWGFDPVLAPRFVAYVGTTPCLNTTVGAGTLHCVTPAGQGTGHEVSVRLDGQVVPLGPNTASNPKVSYRAPTISAVSPERGLKEGDTLTLFGANFGAVVRTDGVSVGREQCMEPEVISHTMALCKGVPKRQGRKALAVAITVAGQIGAMSDAVLYVPALSEEALPPELSSTVATLAATSAGGSALFATSAGVAGSTSGGSAGMAAGVASMSSMVHQMQSVYLLSRMDMDTPSSLAAHTEQYAFASGHIPAPWSVAPGVQSARRMLMGTDTLDFVRADTHELIFAGNVFWVSLLIALTILMDFSLRICLVGFGMMVPCLCCCCPGRTKDRLENLRLWQFLRWPTLQMFIMVLASPGLVLSSTTVLFTANLRIYTFASIIVLTVVACFTVFSCYVTVFATRSKYSGCEYRPNSIKRSVKRFRRLMREKERMSHPLRLWGWIFDVLSVTVWNQKGEWIGSGDFYEKYSVLFSHYTQEGVYGAMVTLIFWILINAVLGVGRGLGSHPTGWGSTAYIQICVVVFLIHNYALFLIIRRPFIGRYAVFREVFFLLIMVIQFTFLLVFALQAAGFFSISVFAGDALIQTVVAVMLFGVTARAILNLTGIFAFVRLGFNLVFLTVKAILRAVFMLIYSMGVRNATTMALAGLATADTALQSNRPDRIHPEFDDIDEDDDMREGAALQRKIRREVLNARDFGMGQADDFGKDDLFDDPDSVALGRPVANYYVKGGKEVSDDEDDLKKPRMKRKISSFPTKARMGDYNDHLADFNENSIPSRRRPASMARRVGKDIDDGSRGVPIRRKITSSLTRGPGSRGYEQVRANSVASVDDQQPDVPPFHEVTYSESDRGLSTRGTERSYLDTRGTVRSGHFSSPSRRSERSFRRTRDSGDTARDSYIEGRLSSRASMQSPELDPPEGLEKFVVNTMFGEESASEDEGTIVSHDMAQYQPRTISTAGTVRTAGTIAHDFTIDMSGANIEEDLGLDDDALFDDPDDLEISEESFDEDEQA